MQDPPPESDANGQEVSLENILAAIQNQSLQTNAAIQQVNEGMERLSEKIECTFAYFMEQHVRVLKLSI